MYIDLFFTIIIIIFVIVFIRNIRHIDLLLLKIKKHKTFWIIIAIILSIYSVMLIDTSSVMNLARDNFMLKIDPYKTPNLSISEYNYVREHASEYEEEYGAIGKARLFLVRIAVLHNFKDGNIWVWYCHGVYSKEGKLMSGSMYIPAQWGIHRENGIWKITDTYEAP